MFVFDQNYITIDILIPFIFSMFLFLSKSQYSIKLFYFINIVSLIYIKITCNCIYIYHSIVVNSLNEKANLHIDQEKFDFNKYLFGIYGFI